MKSLLTCIVCACIFVACNEGSKATQGKEVVSAVAAGNQTDEEIQKELKALQEAERKKIEEEQKNSTTLEFDKIKHDFGDVKPEVQNTCKFKVTNTGKNPLIIESVSASCGCTTPHKPEKPIPPGKSDYIEVGFKSKPGQKDEITKTVTVTANTLPKVSELSIRAFVK